MGRKKLTPWFDADVKPARRDVYQKRGLFSSGTFYNYWNGRRWSKLESSARRAYAARGFHGDGYPRAWRGLTEKPK